MVTAVIGDPADGFDHAQELQRMTAQAGAIAALANAALEGLTLEALRRRTAETVRVVLGVEHASVPTPDPDAAGIALAAGSGWPRPSSAGPASATPATARPASRRSMIR